LLLVAIVGPAFAPDSPTGLIGIPFEGPSREHLLGLDYLGRDGLSRFLNGGRNIIALALIATVLSEIIGSFIGLVSAYARNWLDTVLMRLADILIAIPAIILVLVLVSGSGPSVTLVVIGVMLAHIPRVARLVRGTALEVAMTDYVAAAETRGEKTSWILGREIAPNVAGPILVDFGLRLSSSVIIVSGLAFLGFGLQPPAADWGLMINENRAALTTQPYVVAAPALALAALAIGVNLVTDGVARALGREEPT
jgi:peptide/nickel transport system permease protein